MLEITQLEVSYGAVQAVKGIDLEVKDGELISLIGNNGAGKTTTLHAISGLLKAKAGSIKFNGQELTVLKPYEILQQGVAQVPEGREVFPELTVFENLEMGAYLTSKDSKLFNDTLEMCYTYFPILPKRKNQLARTLSGGEQQMLVIARALMSQPKLLLLDEPSLGLAPMVVEQVMSIIQEINKKGVAVLLVEQNANLALEISNRGYVMETGKIVLSDDSKNLLDNEEVKTAYLGI